MFKKHRICADYILLAMAAMAQDRSKKAAGFMGKAIASPDLIDTLSEIAKSNKEVFARKTRKSLASVRRSKSRLARRRLQAEMDLGDELDIDDFEEESDGDMDHNPDNDFMDDDYEEGMPDDMEYDDDDFEEESGGDMEYEDDEDMLEVESRVKQARRNRRNL